MRIIEYSLVLRQASASQATTAGDNARLNVLCTLKITHIRIRNPQAPQSLHGWILVDRRNIPGPLGNGLVGD